MGDVRYPVMTARDGAYWLPYLKPARKCRDCGSKPEFASWIAIGQPDSLFLSCTNRKCDWHFSPKTSSRHIYVTSPDNKDVVEYADMVEKDRNDEYVSDYLKLRVKQWNRIHKFSKREIANVKYNKENPRTVDPIGQLEL